MRIPPFVFCMIVAVFGPTCLADEGADQGATDDVSIVMNAISNAVDSLETSIAELTQRERRVVTQSSLGLMDKQTAAIELYALSTAYFNSSDFVEAERLAMAGTDLVPNSYIAAKCWTRVGHVAMTRRESFKLSVKAFQNADNILVALLADKPNDELFKSRALVLDRMGFVCDCTQQPEQSCKFYRELVDTPDVARCAGTERLLVANQVLASNYAQVGDVTTSLKFYDELARLSDSNKIPPEKALPLLISRIKTRWTDVDAPQRIQAFEDLWASDKYGRSVEILAVGDELLSHYYFTRPINKPRFEAVSELFFSRVNGFQQLYTPNDINTRVNNFDSVLGTALVMSADYAGSKADKKAHDRFVDMFNKTFESTDPTFSIPVDRPQVRLSSISLIYQSNMTKHWAAYQQRLKDLKDL